MRKGQYEELLALANGLRSGSWPIALQDQIDVTRLSFEIENKLKLQLV
jgi:hypothetical protein